MISQQRGVSIGGLDRTAESNASHTELNQSKHLDTYPDYQYATVTGRASSISGRVGGEGPVSVLGRRRRAGMVSRLDVFGYPVSLTYAGEREFRTPCGTMLSIVAAVIMIVFLVGLASPGSVWSDGTDTQEESRRLLQAASSGYYYSTQQLAYVSEEPMTLTLPTEALKDF